MTDKALATRQTESASEDAVLMPPVDVVEDSAAITLYADLPGVPRDKLTINVEGDTLTIAGEVHLDAPQGMESTYAEVSVPRYRRTFSLSKDLDAEHINAELEKGVLKLRIPKAAHAQPRKIEVRVE